MDAKNVVAEVWANLDNSAYDLETVPEFKARAEALKLTLCRKAKFENMNQEPKMKGYICKCRNIYWRTKASQCRDCEEEADDSEPNPPVIFQDAHERPYTPSHIHPAKILLPLLR
jgi:hypothetical protein